MIKAPHVIACPIVFILFYGWDWRGGVFKVIKNDLFVCFFVFLTVWAGPFPQVFRQVKEWLILELHEVIRVLSVVACPIDFNLLCDRSPEGGVLKLMKIDHFLVLLTVRVLFSKLLGWWRVSWLILELNETKKVLHVVAFPIVYVLVYHRDVQGGVFKVMKNNPFLVFLGRRRSSLYSNCMNW